MLRHPSRTFAALLALIALALVVPAAASAATMQVQIFIKGKGSVTGPDFFCENTDPNPANVRSCDTKLYTAPDPLGQPLASFTANPNTDAGWSFASWSALVFTSCIAIDDNVCTIRGRQNSFVERPATVDFTRGAAPSLSIAGSSSGENSGNFQFVESEGVKSTNCVLENALTNQGIASAACPGIEGDGWRRAPYGGLGEGIYRFRFQVTDFFDHFGEVVDHIAVVGTRIASAPPPFSNDNTPQFTFGTGVGTAFTCWINGVTTEQPCSSPYTAPALPADGTYTLNVRAVRDRFFDPSPSTHTWRLDRKPPTISIGEPAEGATVSSPVTTFAFSAGDDASASQALTFECRTDHDSGPFSPCANPYVTAPLAIGAHRLDVRSVDQAGNRSAVARRNWTVDFPDGDGDGFRSNVDCNDADPAIRPDAAEILDNGVDENCDGIVGVDLDRDRDGYPRPADCNDGNAQINPGAKDIPGNDVDEDCKDGPAPPPTVSSAAFGRWRYAPLRFTKLWVTNATKGSTVRVRCKGGRCPFAAKATKVKRTAKALHVIGRLKQAPLKRGSVVEVAVTRPGYTGMAFRWTVRGAKQDPAFSRLCLPKGKPAQAC